MAGGSVVMKRLLRSSAYLFVLLLAGLLCHLSEASAQTQKFSHGSLTLVADKAWIDPGQDFTLGLHFSLENGWHIYWVNPATRASATGEMDAAGRSDGRVNRMARAAQARDTFDRGLRLPGRCHAPGADAGFVPSGDGRPGNDTCFAEFADLPRHVHSGENGGFAIDSSKGAATTIESSHSAIIRIGESKAAAGSPSRLEVQRKRGEGFFRAAD